MTHALLPLFGRGMKWVSSSHHEARQPRFWHRRRPMSSAGPVSACASVCPLGLCLRLSPAVPAAASSGSTRTATSSMWCFERRAHCRARSVGFLPVPSPPEGLLCWLPSIASATKSSRTPAVTHSSRRERASVRRAGVPGASHSYPATEQALRGRFKGHS
jgi:hypothetical protein